MFEIEVEDEEELGCCSDAQPCFFDYVVEVCRETERTDVDGFLTCDAGF